jgi:hypothetical protein
MNRMKAIVTGSLLGLSLLLGAGQPAYAAAVMGQWNNTWTPSAWTRRITPGTLYAVWNVFNNETVGGGKPIEDTTPDAGNFGGGTYRLREGSVGGYIDSTSGNIWQSGVATPPP